MAARLTRRCGLAIALVLFAATSAGAQVYVSGVWSIASRESGTGGISPAEPKNVQAGTVIVGVHLTEIIAIEGSVELQQRQSFNWYQGYAILFSPTFQLLTERDTPVAVNLRFAASCSNRFCLNLLAGGGFNKHQATSEAYAICTFAHPAPPCEPFSPSRPATPQESWEFMLLVGFDVPIRVSRHLAIGPTMRFHIINRTEDLTGYGFRGPQSGSGMVPSFGVAVTWRSK